MKRASVCLLFVAMLAVSCSDSDGNTLPTVSAGELANSSCLVGDPDCADGADGGAAGPLPDTITLGDPDNPDAPLQISYGGFFFSDGTVSQLCSALAESFPPQCGSLVVEVVAPLDTVLEHVAESFGNPDDAKINIEQGVYWTDDWINLSGTLEGNNLVLE